jgi:hypothetical protein
MPCAIFNIAQQKRSVPLKWFQLTACSVTAGGALLSIRYYLCSANRRRTGACGQLFGKAGLNCTQSLAIDARVIMGTAASNFFEPLLSDLALTSFKIAHLGSCFAALATLTGFAGHVISFFDVSTIVFDGFCARSQSLEYWLLF